MIDTWHLPPPRIMIGIAVTLFAVLALGLRSCAGSDGRSGSSATSTTGASVETTGASAAVEEAPSTSIVLAPDWYPKQSSRYSDRRPVVTVTTLPPTTTTRPRAGTSSSVGGD